MKSRNPVLLLVTVAALAASAALAQSTVYRWVDKDGKVQFTDTPPPASATGVTQKRMGGGGEDVQLPFATQIAAQRHPVTLYVSNDCGELCSQGRALLAKRGIPYAEKNAQTNKADAEALQKLAGALSVPYLAVGATGVLGFDEAGWTAALDRAGYARTRLPGQPAPRPQSPEQPAPPSQ
jgi:glutaredoxin